MTASPGKKIAIILNGISFQKNRFYNIILPALQSKHSVDVFETLSKNDGIMLARKAADKYMYDVILAAGGDGTLHQVVNGVLLAFEKEHKIPTIGIIPLGSGNDFAKTAKIKADPALLLKLLDENKPVNINTGEVFYANSSGGTDRRFFINVVDVGMGPEVVKRVLDSGRIFGPAVAYFKSILMTFKNYTPMIVHATAENWTWSGKLRSLGVANGKFYGHGLCIAPDAKPNDDIFSVFICGNVSVFDFIRHSGTMKKCKKINMPEVKYLETKDIKLTSEEICLLEADGEILGSLPATVRLFPRKIPMLIPGL